MRANIVIIGAGIAGVSLAARLAGQADVVVLETEEQPGLHATGRSAAMFEPNYGNATLRALTRAGQAFFDQPDEIDTPCLLSERGILFVATETERAALDAQHEIAPDLEALTTRQAQELVPILRADAACAALLGQAAHDIDVDRMFQGFLRLARRHGARFETGAQARVQRDGAGWRVTAGAMSITAEIVVNAAGAWADEVAQQAGVRPRGLVPLRRSAALLPAPEDPGFARWPMLTNASETWYAKPEAGRYMVSPSEEDPVPPMDAFPDDLVMAQGLDRFAQATTYPVTRVLHQWAGLRTFAPDRTPVVGFDAAAPGFFWLAGQGGYGIQTAPVLSQLAADLLVGQSPSMPAEICAALDPNRPGIGA